MGFTNEIYISRLEAVQQKLNATAAKVNLNAPTFYKTLEQAVVAVEQGIALEAEQQAEAPQLATGDYADIINEAAAKYGISPNLIKAVMRVESSFRENAVSSAGAQGLMQLMPNTAKSLGVEDSFDAYENIMGGSEYLKTQLDRFGDVRLALAAYNTGPNRVASYGITDIDNNDDYSKISERVRSYVDKVLNYQDVYDSGSQEV